MGVKKAGRKKAVVRVRAREIILYQILKTELDSIKNGAHHGILLNLLMTLVGAALSGILTVIFGGVAEQRWVWAIGFIVFIIVCALIGYFLYRTATRDADRIYQDVICGPDESSVDGPSPQATPRQKRIDGSDKGEE